MYIFIFLIFIKTIFGIEYINEVFELKIYTIYYEEDNILYKYSNSSKNIILNHQTQCIGELYLYDNKKKNLTTIKSKNYFFHLNLEANNTYYFNFSIDIDCFDGHEKFVLYNNINKTYSIEKSFIIHFWNLKNGSLNLTVNNNKYNLIEVSTNTKFDDLFYDIDLNIYNLDNKEIIERSINDSKYISYVLNPTYQKSLININWESSDEDEENIEINTISISIISFDNNLISKLNQNEELHIPFHLVGDIIKRSFFIDLQAPENINKSYFILISTILDINFVIECKYINYKMSEENYDEFKYEIISTCKMTQEFLYIDKNLNNITREINDNINGILVEFKAENFYQDIEKNEIIVELFPEVINTNCTKTLKDGKQRFFIYDKSFQGTKNLIIYSNQSKHIIFDNNLFNNKTLNFYIIPIEIFNTYEFINFTLIGNKNVNNIFYFIFTDKNINIYDNRNFNKESILLSSGEETYYLFTSNNPGKEIIYLDIEYGNLTIYRNNLYKSIEEIFSLNFKEINDYIEINDKGEVYKIIPSNDTRFTFKSFIIQDNSKDFNYNNNSYSASFFIKKNKSYKIGKITQINYYQIQLFPKRKNTTTNILMNNENITLTNNKTIYKKTNYLNENNVTIKSTEDTLLTFFFGYSNYNNVTEKYFQIDKPIDFLFIKTEENKFRILKIENKEIKPVNFGYYLSLKNNVDKFYYFNQSNLINLKYNEYFLIDIDNPLLNVYNYISIFSKSLLYYEYFDYYYTKSNFYSQEFIELNSITQYKIFEYDFQSYENKSIIMDIIYLSKNTNYGNMNIYIHKYRKDIYKILNEENLNLLKNIKEKQHEKKNIIYIDNILDIVKDKFYITFYLEYFETPNKDLKFRFQLYNPTNYYLINNESFKLEVGIIENIIFHFKIPAKKFNKKYINYDWFNEKDYVKCRIIFKNSSDKDEYKKSYRGYEEYDYNKDYEIKYDCINQYTKKYSQLKLLIYLSDDLSIKTIKNDFEKNSFIIVSPNIVFLVNNITDEGIGETITYMITYNKNKMHQKYLFNDSIYYENITKMNNLDSFETMDTLDNNHFSLIKKKNNFVIIGIEFDEDNFEPMNELIYQKIQKPIEVSNDYEKVFNSNINDTKKFIINQNSFLSNKINASIVIYSSKNSTIFFDKIISNRSRAVNIFVFSKNNVNENIISFTVSSKNVQNFTFKIIYFNKSIKYINTDFNKSYYISLNQNNEIYYLGIYLDINSFIYINKLRGNVAMQYKKYINNIVTIDNLLEFDNITYNYPFIINSPFGLFKFSCSEYCEFEMRFFNQTTNIVLSEGIHIPIYIKKNEPLNFSLEWENISQFEIELIVNNENDRNITILFDDEKKQLNNNNSINIIEKKYKKVSFEGDKNYDCLVFISNPLNITQISKKVNYSKFENSYYGFIIQTNFTNKLAFTNIHIKFNETDYNIYKICYFISFGNITKVYKKKYSCHNVTYQTPFSISIKKENYSEWDSDTLTEVIYVFYIKNYTNLIYSYDFYDNVKQLDLFLPIKINIKENNSVIYLLNSNNMINNLSKKQQLMILFEKINEGGKLYLYQNSSSISMENNNFLNYIEKKNLTESINNIFYFENDALTNNYFYLILQSDLNQINNTIEIYHNNKIIKIKDDYYKRFKFINPTNFTFSIKNDKKKDLYLNIQWVNLNSKSIIEIKKNKENTSDTSQYFKDYSLFILLETNNEYYITFEENTTNYSDTISYLDILFHCYNNKIFNLSEHDSFNISIISKQILYFYIDISRIPTKEPIEFVINKNINIKYENPKVNLFNHFEIEKIIDNPNTKYETINFIEEEKEKYIYSFNKSTINIKSVLVKINITFVQYSEELKRENFRVELINRKKFIFDSFEKDFLQNETGYYYINESSFKEFNEITIYSNESNQIKFSPKIFSIEYKKFYLIQKKMLENIKEINITFGNNNKEFSIEVNYINKKNLFDILPMRFYDSKKNVKLTIKIKDKPILLIFSFVNFSPNDTILYIDKREEKGKNIYIYRNDSIDNFQSFINEYYDYSYFYPIESKEEYEVLILKGAINTTLKIIFYDYITSNLGEIQEGKTFPLFITNNITYIFQLNNISKKISFRIKLETNEMKKLFLQFLYDDKTFNLYEENIIIHDELVLNKNSLKFNLLKGEAIFIFFSICYKKTDTHIHSVTKNLKQFTKDYNTFFYPKEKNSEFGIINFLNEKNEPLDIYYEEIISKINSTFSLNNREKITINNTFNFIFENPINYYNLKYDEEKLIVFHIPNYQYIKYTFNLYKRKNILNYGTIYLNNNKINYSEIFCYENNKEKKINVILNENITNPVTLYIYNNISKIYFNGKKFDNCKNNSFFFKEPIFYYETNDKNLYFIFDYNELNLLSFDFIDSEIKHNIILNEKKKNFEFYTNGNTIQKFDFIYKSSLYEENMHLQWKILHKKIKVRLEYNSSTYHSYNNSDYCSEKSIFIQCKFDETYNFKFMIQNKQKLKGIKIYFSFFSSEYQNILSFNIKDDFSFPILVKQQYYFIQDISSLLVNENIEYSFSNYENISLFTKFCNETPTNFSNITDYEFTNYTNIITSSNELFYRLTKQYNNTILIFKIDFNPNNIIFEQDFNISKKISTTYIETDQEIKINGQGKRHFQFTLNSKSNNIILSTEDVNALSVINQDNYPNSKNLYIIDEEMVKRGIIFQSFNNMVDYILKIIYIPNNKIIHVLNRKEINNFSYRILINDCSKENYYFGNFNKKKTYLYIEILYGDPKIKMKNINNFTNLKDFFDFEKNEIYEKPIINTKEINFFKFECTKTSLLYIKYYPYNEFIQRNILIKYGNEFGWLLKNDFYLDFNIEKKSEIFQNEFNYEIKLLTFSNEYTVNFDFNNRSKSINEKSKKILRDKCNKITLNNLKLLTKNYESFFIFKIGLNRSTYNIVKHNSKVKVNHTFEIFFYPNDDKIINTTIKIKNLKGELSGKICLNEGFSEDGYVNFMDTECFYLNNNEDKIFNTSNPYLHNQYKGDKFYSVFYFENPKNIEVEFSYKNTKLNKPSIYYIFIITIIVLVIALLIFIFLYFKKNKANDNDDIHISLINETIKDKVINFIEDNGDDQDW